MFWSEYKIYRQINVFCLIGKNQCKQNKYFCLICQNKFSWLQSELDPQPYSWVLVYELSGYGFKCRCSRLNFRYRTCFEQGVPWHSGDCRVFNHSKCVCDMKHTDNTCLWQTKSWSSRKLISTRISRISRYLLYELFRDIGLEFWV